MAIRDKFRRAVGTSRKSTSTTSSASSTHASETSTLASSTDSEVPSPASTVSDRKSRTRTFAWRPSKTAEEKDLKKNRKKAGSDPREKPFTELNLRYQEILGSYELTFGTSHPEQLWNPDGELSPGTSRHNSVDLGRN